MVSKSWNCIIYDYDRNWSKSIEEYKSNVAVNGIGDIDCATDSRWWISTVPLTVELETDDETDKILFLDEKKNASTRRCY